MQYISHINVAQFFFEGKHRIAALWQETRQFPSNGTKRAKTSPFPHTHAGIGIERTRHGGKAGSADSYTLYILMWRLAQQASTSKTSVALHTTRITIRHSNHGDGGGTGGNNRHNRAQHDAHP